MNIPRLSMSRRMCKKIGAHAAVEELVNPKINDVHQD